MAVNAAKATADTCHIFSSQFFNADAVSCMDAKDPLTLLRDFTACSVHLTDVWSTSSVWADIF